MPRGLPSVEQKFDIDSSGYDAGMARMIEDNNRLIASIDGTMRKIREMAEAADRPQGAGAFLRDYNRMLDENNRLMRDAEAANRAYNAAQEQTARLSRDGADALRGLQEAYGLVTAEADRHTAAQDRLAEAHMRDMPLLDQMVSKLGAARDAYAAIPEASAPLAYTTKHVQALSDALDVAERRANSFATAFYGAGGASRGGDAQRGIGAGAFGPFDPNFISGGGGGGGGGGAAGGAFAGGLAGKIFGGALPTLQVAHMATMLTMEIASQVIPAVVAAGAAAAVGYQGGAAAYQRGQGIYAAGEALGGAYGVTPGQLFGMGSGYQVAQNQATGGVYGAIGSIMRMAGQGTGPGSILGPGGMGVQTVAMIDRGLANMVGSGRMNQLQTALGGGTGALRTIGDIGANLGDTLLNVAPNLPGMGGLLFGGLEGATGLASWLTGGLARGAHIGGQTVLPAGIGQALLGGGLAAEAGWRWGGPILGGGKLPGWLGGAKFGGLAGMAERFGLGTVGDAAAGVDAAGLAGVLGGGAAGPIGLAAALAAFAGVGLSKTMPTASMRQMGGLQAAIGSSFGAGSLTPITKALYQAGQGAAGIPGGGAAGYVANYVPAMQAESGGMGTYARFGPGAGMGPTAAQVFGNTVTSASEKLGEMTASAKTVSGVLDGMGVKGATFGQAMDFMTMAMISPKDVGPGGKLDKTAMSQLASFVQAYSLMGSGGKTSASAILSASNADYIMASPQMKKLAQVNQALDSVTQIMTGGPANASALYQAAAAAPAGMASALGKGPFTATGAAAWQAFTNPQTGIMAASQANMDQLRTFMTIGGLKGPQAAQLGAFELQQGVMPFASQSPMALAMLQQQAMQAGVPGVKMGQSFAATQKAINAHAGTLQQANALMTRGTQAAANIPAVADFLNPNANVNPLQAALYAQMAQSAITAARHPTGGNVAALESVMSMSGVKPGQMKVGVDAILQNLHVPTSLIVKINGELHLPKPPVLHGKVEYTSHFSAAAPPVLRGTVIYTGQMAGQVGSRGGHTAQAGYRVPGYGGGDIFPAMLEPGEAVVPKHLVPQLAPFLGAHGVPGFAAGGLAGLGVFEAVTSKSIAVLAQAVSSLASAIGGGGAGAPMPAAAQKVFNAYDATLPKGIWGQFASQVLQGLIAGVKNAPHETAKMAQALVSQVQKEVAYGQGVAAAAKQGGGYNPWGGGSTLLGTFGNFATPTTTAGGQPYQYYTDQAGGQPLSVQQQMGDYLQAMKSFQGDLGKLGKAGLNKNLMQQLIAAGPLQGDQMAQSILGGAGGAKGANQLWGQINAAANQLGVGAAGSVYGTGGKGVRIPVHADTAAAQAAINQIHGKSVVITVSLNMGGGGAGGGGGGVKLSDGQIKQVTAQVQAALLKQAKTNRRTGVSLPGYGT